MGNAQTLDQLDPAFSYVEFTNRNIGFVTEQEQAQLQATTVFVCGVGGMGGACVMALARAGIGRLVLADIDAFEVSNLNRHAFAFTDTISRHKADATAELCGKINPQLEITIHRADWPDQLEAVARRSSVIINGTDDLGASLHLYRTARATGKAVIDAYASPLPSVYVTRAGNPMPEERLGYPTIGTEWHAVTEAQWRAAFLCEAVYVITHSSSRKYLDLKLAGEFAAGARSRMSFAPMVITTGMLMAYEAIQLILGKPSATDYRGWFFNPYTASVERPRNPFMAALLRPVVRRFLTKLLDGAGGR